MMADRYQRLRATQMFRDGAFARWHAACVGIIGCGTLGSRLAPEAVRSGARVRLWDPDRVEEQNLGTQVLRRGLSKVESTIRQCNEIREESASGAAVDIRHIGVGELNECDILIDLTDDPRLAWPLTEITNGLRKPLIRAALDGSGRCEMGRVLCSDPREGGSCQLCTYSVDDLVAAIEPAACPGRSTPERAATLAGGPLAEVIAGTALIQAQRIVTGNGTDLALGQEITIDLTHMHLMRARIARSSHCLSGHVVWEWLRIPQEAAATIGSAVDFIACDLGQRDFMLEPFGHPLCIEAGCGCGATMIRVGSIWAGAPDCPVCGGRMHWRSESQRAALHPAHVEELGIADRTLQELGLPDGVMFSARLPDRRTRRYVMDVNLN
jgi:molybdopterin/thiamine biosynthesis adenylyltransferase